MHCVCVVRSRSCRLPARNEKEREKKKRERERGTTLPRRPSKGEGVCVRACWQRRGERRGSNAAWTRAACSRREEGGGVSRGQSFAPPPPAPNNLLVFHVRFDSLSFRYLYLPGPLRISGISGISRAWGLGRRREEGGGREKKGKNKRGKKTERCTHEGGGEGGVTALE